MGGQVPEKPEGYEQRLGGIASLLCDAFGGNSTDLLSVQVCDCIRACAPNLALVGTNIAIKQGEVELRLGLLLYSEELSCLLVVALQPPRGECSDDVFQSMVDWELLTADGLKRPRVKSRTIGPVVDLGGSRAPRYALRRVPGRVGVEYVSRLPPEISEHLPKAEDLQEELRVLIGVGE